MTLYEVLGINEKASQDDIKRAYRRLAMMYHPDRVPEAEKATAEAKFKEVKDAYETLSDPQKRQDYDDRQTASFVYKKGSWQNNPQKEDWARKFEEAMRDYYAKKPDFDGWDEAEKYEYDYEVNDDVNVDQEITLEQAFTGCDIKVSHRSGGWLRTILVAVPAGIEHGQKLRSKGGGERSYPDEKPGDLYVHIKIKPKDGWERKGVDLYQTVDVNVLDLVVGGSVSVQTIEGTTLEVEIRAGTATTAVIRIPGRGMPKLHDGKRGDMFLVINPIVKAAPEEAKTLVDQIKNLIS